MSAGWTAGAQARGLAARHSGPTRQAEASRQARVGIARRCCRADMPPWEGVEWLEASWCVGRRGSGGAVQAWGGLESRGSWCFAAAVLRAMRATGKGSPARASGGTAGEVRIEWCVLLRGSGGAVDGGGSWNRQVRGTSRQRCCERLRATGKGSPAGASGRNAGEVGI